MGFFDKIKTGLTKTRKAMESSLGEIFSGFATSPSAVTLLVVWSLVSLPPRPNVVMSSARLRP